MSVVKEFTDFAMRGNVVDLAAGIVVGAAFSKIVSSFVADVLMPVIGLLVGGVNFTDLALTLKAGTDDTEPVLLKYGVLIQTVIDFLIIAFSMFLIIKGLNTLMRRTVTTPAK